jgi:Arc/MetJ family transcription regulator
VRASGWLAGDRTDSIAVRTWSTAPQRSLGTKTTTETLHAALRDSVRQARLRRLAERDLSGLTPDALAELRRPRGAAH